MNRKSRKRKGQEIMEPKEEANQSIPYCVAANQLIPDCAETRKSSSPLADSDKEYELPELPPLPDDYPEIGQLSPEIMLNYVERYERFPHPDTYAIGLALTGRYFFTYGFEVQDLPYSETGFESPQDLETAKRFLNQIRQTGGYDVDCRPPRSLKSPLYPVDLEKDPRQFELAFIRPVLFAIKQINEEEGLSLELVELVKVVDTYFFLKFFTFTVKQDACAEAVETVQALVGDPIGEPMHLFEWKGLHGKPLLQVSP